MRPLPPLPMTDSYFKLIKEFPLRHIRDNDELAAALEMIDRLLRAELDAGARDYLDALTDLVETFEDRHSSIPAASEADVLRVLLESSGLSQSGLAKRVGIAQSTLSAVLTGARTLTKTQVVKLARFFGVPASTFLPA